MFDQDELPSATQAMPRPFRLNLLGVAAALALFARLAAANDFLLDWVDESPTLLVLALASVLAGLSLILLAAERDRVSAPLLWIALVTAASWGVLNWLSPPFRDGTPVFVAASQPALAAIGFGNGLLPVSYTHLTLPTTPYV